MTADYLIIGQGLCGTWLSYWLMSMGATVLVIDPGTAGSASSVASGIINPITGKRLARQWMGDEILPFAAEAYARIGAKLEVIAAKETVINTFFATAEEAAFFESKAATTHEDLLAYNSRIAASGAFNYHYGVGTIAPAMLVDVRALLAAWRGHLITIDALAEAPFMDEDFEIAGNGVAWKGIRARAVIDCRGAATASGPCWSRLPFALNSGEAFIASVPGLPRDAIFKHGNLSVVPWGDDKFWIGSTYDWNAQKAAPTAAFRLQAEATLRSWLKLPFEIHEHLAAMRPATVTRDAFAGMHPVFPQVGILNGTGSKGCSLAPFLAMRLANHLVHGEPLIPQTDVAKYGRVLSR